MNDRPLLVGVTGGLGSGKSTVCRILAEYGCEIFEADSVARQLQVTDPVIIEGIRRLFGNEVYQMRADGVLWLDRPAIARRVFADASLLQKLNRLIHPAVYSVFQSAVDDARRKGINVLVKEAAILFESGGDTLLDCIVVVTADRELRIQRALQRGGASREDIIRRINAQWPQEELVRRADYVIDNSGTFDQLKSRTRQVYELIVRDAL